MLIFLKVKFLAAVEWTRRMVTRPGFGLVEHLMAGIVEEATVGFGSVNFQFI